MSSERKTGLRAVFYVDTTERPWLKILLWWEWRRILYNALLVVFSGLSFGLISLLPDTGYFKVLPGPALVLWAWAAVIGFFLGANFCYTLGWVVQLATLRLNVLLVNRLAPYLFIIGLAISFFVILIPFALSVLNIVLPDPVLEFINSLINTIWSLLV